jgi:hypothetical protein
MTKTCEDITQAVLGYPLHKEPVMRPDIHIQDVFEDIASVTVRTRGLHEYLHLVRGARGWEVANAIWQTR